MTLKLLKNFFVYKVQRLGLELRAKNNISNDGMEAKLKFLSST